MASYDLPPGSNGTIPLDDAVQQTANWRDYLADSDLITKAFCFSIDTFKNLMNANPEADGIRVYLGLKTAGDPESMTALLVGVIDNKDIVSTESADGGLRGDPPPVYNFAEPCPPICDIDSPLG